MKENKETKIRELSKENKIKKLKKINLLSIITRNKFKKAKVNFKSIKHNSELSRNKTKYNFSKLNNFPYLSENSIKNLTSRELQGYYNFETKRTDKNHLLDEENLEKKVLYKKIQSNKKKLFLTNNNFPPYSYRSFSTDLTNPKMSNNDEKKKLKMKPNQKLGNLNSFTIKNNIHQKESLKLSKASLIDRLMLKLINPDESFEDYMIEEKLRDKYIGFKKKINKKMTQMYKMLFEVELEQIKSMRELKKYNADLQRKEYILKTRERNKLKILN
jgi:hypothetical protein